MAFCRQSFLILFALILGGGISFAASATKEQRAYAAAMGAFQDGMWNRAEIGFDWDLAKISGFHQRAGSGAEAGAGGNSNRGN